MRCAEPRRWRLILSVGLLMLGSPKTAYPASIVTEWFDEAVPIANDVAWEPTVGARFFAIVSTAMYDAWTTYDPRAVAAVSGTAFKNRGGAANEANKREAISHAAYTVLCALAPQYRRELAEQMTALGYDPSATSAPAVVGREAANAVLTKFREDGANEAGGFADTTGYRPKGFKEAGHWQPILSIGKPQLPTTPQWPRVVPFALARADQFRPPPPPRPESEAWRRQIVAEIDAAGALTEAHKAAAEFWNEWGSSPPHHLMELTTFVSDLRGLRIDADIKLFFVVSNALLDASIASWDAKYAYDYVRPITAIRSLGNIEIRTWRPRSLPAVLAYSSPATTAAFGATVVPAGIGAVRAKEWEPYLPTPPFPSYVSGHSAFCGAWARVMTLATGTPELDFRVTVKHLYVEQRELMPPVILDYPTYDAAADACGQSRIWGGIHWPVDNERGLQLGRSVGENAWNRAQQFLIGTASPATAAMVALHPPFWFHQSKDADHDSKFSDSTGLAMDLTPGASGGWRSVVLDPVPTGLYELKLKVKTEGEAPLRFRVAVDAGEGQGTPTLASSESVIPPSAPKCVLTLLWNSDGARSFNVSVQAGAESGPARVLVTAMDLVRIWPIIAGSPRFVEPSLAGQLEK